MKHSEHPIWAGKPSILGQILRTIVLVIACVLVLIPFLAVIMTSFASAQEISAAGGFVLWTTKPSLAAYQAILSGGVVTQALLVSIGVTVIGTLFSLVVTILLAYSLSRPGSLLHTPLILIVLFTLLFSPGMIPTYLTVRQFGLIDNLAALILPVAVSGFNVIIMRSFFLELPDEILDSGRIDGAGDGRILVNIVLPLSKAVIAVIGLFYAVSYWNAFFTALLYIQTPSKWPLQLVLRTFVVNETPLAADQLAAQTETLPPQTSVQMAILMISILPILVVYPFIQRHFSKGLMIGAVKG